MGDRRNLARIQKLMAKMADDWATRTTPRDLNSTIGPVLSQLDGWDEMCAATWSLALIAGDTLRTHHGLTPDQQLPLVFANGTDGTVPDIDDVPPPIRAAGRYFNAAVHRDIDNAAAIWESVPKPDTEVGGPAAEFLNAVWFASLEAYRTCHQIGSSQ